MPLMRFTGKGQMRDESSADVTIVRPLGLSSSELILASSLLGAIPIELVSPVARYTRALMRSAIA